MTPAPNNKPVLSSSSTSNNHNHNHHSKQQQQQSSSSSSSLFVVPYQCTATTTNIWLIVIILFQWILFTIIINDRYDRESYTMSRLIETESKYKDLYNRKLNKLNNKHDCNTTTTTSLNDSRHRSSTTKRQLPTTTTTTSNDNINNENDNNETIDGVFVMIIYKAPRWMHLRYNYIIQNAVLNLPTNWKIQIFVNEHWALSNLYPYHPGLYRLLHPTSIASNLKTATTTTTTTSTNKDTSRFIIKTELPTNLTTSRTKPKHILQSKWFWNTVVADAVVLFSSNGIFCSNTILDPTTYWTTIASSFDYMGVPTGSHHLNTMGGDGTTHSYRNKKAMLRVYDYIEQHNIDISKNSNTEFRTVLDIMIRINKEILQSSSNNNDPNHDVPFRLPNITTIEQFGSVYNISTETSIRHLPIVVSGIQDQLTYAERDTLLKHCPELKVIFPSLHEPGCFGAHPNPIKCKASICALQDTIPGSGC